MSFRRDKGHAEQAVGYRAFYFSNRIGLQFKRSGYAGNVRTGYCSFVRNVFLSKIETSDIPVKAG